MGDYQNPIEYVFIRSGFGTSTNSEIEFVLFKQDLARWTWSKQSLLSENIDFKVTSIDNTSTDSQYPSAKCVYNEVNTRYIKPSGGIPKSDLSSSVQGSLNNADSAVQPDAISAFITRSVNDLVNYYTKSDTYTRTEIQSLIGSIQGFSYEIVASLPTASSETLGKIYLVPSTDPQTRNVKDEYITIESSGSYSWEQIGSTSINLENYVTTDDLNAALANY